MSLQALVLNVSSFPSPAGAVHPGDGPILLAQGVRPRLPAALHQQVWGADLWTRHVTSRAQSPRSWHGQIILLFPLPLVFAPSAHFLQASDLHFTLSLTFAHVIVLSDLALALIPFFCL